MADLIIAAGTTRIIDGSVPLEEKYDLFQMQANSTIVAKVDLVIKADHAEFDTGCVIDASGNAGTDGVMGGVAIMHPGGVAEGGAGENGMAGTNGHNVTIDAGLVTVGNLKILANGGAGGRGGSGGPPAPSNPFIMLSNGGRGGNGGNGGNGGQIVVRWAAKSSSIPADVTGAPTGHNYRADGGVGGSGGPGSAAGPSASTAFAYGVPGAPGNPGNPGAASVAQITWRPRTRTTIWVQKQDMGPASRMEHAMAWDAERKQLVLFGGGPEQELLGDTWEWDGQLWIQTGDIGPSPRCMQEMTYDPVNKQILLFGGSRDRDAAGDNLFGDTWLWDGQEWIQVADTGPAPRRKFALATDLQRKRIVLFGGELAGGALARDTWEWDGTEWTHGEDVGPSARKGPRMAYDAWNELLVLFGGDDGAMPNDTWGWNGKHWAQLADTGPLGRVRHAIAEDGVGVVLFGGEVDLAEARALNLDVSIGETWAFYENRWRQIHDVGPSLRSAHAMAYDPGAHRVILFGGQQSDPKALLRDTWYLNDRQAKKP